MAGLAGSSGELNLAIKTLLQFEEDFDVIVALKGLVAWPSVLSTSGGLIWEMSGKAIAKRLNLLIILCCN